MIKFRNSRKHQFLWSIFLGLSCSLLKSVAATEQQTYSWTTLEGFELDWKHPDGKPNTGKAYDLPSLFKEGLTELDESTNAGVWVEAQTPGQFHYQFSIPTACELTDVRVSVKYYGVAEDSSSTFYVYPCQSGPTGSEGCHLTLGSSLEWVTVEHVMSLENITDSSEDPDRSVGIMGVYNSGQNENEFFMFDELFVKIEYENCEISSTVETTTVETTTVDTTTTKETTTTAQPPITDPDACDHSCEYVGIDCHNYYSCIDFKYKEFHKCAKKDGLAFNPGLKTCDKIENVEGCAPPTSSTPPPDDCICEYRPFPDDCSKYYYCPDTCQEDLCEVRTCPDGLLWTVDADGDGTGHQQCVMEQKAVCASTGPMLEFSCYRKQDGVYRNHKDCHSFWKCAGGKPLLYNCGNGYIFNSVEGICDFPEKAQRFCSTFGIDEQYQQ